MKGKNAKDMLDYFDIEYELMLPKIKDDSLANDFSKMHLSRIINSRAFKIAFAKYIDVTEPESMYFYFILNKLNMKVKFGYESIDTKEIINISLKELKSKFTNVGMACDLEVLSLIKCNGDNLATALEFVFLEQFNSYRCIDNWYSISKKDLASTMKKLGLILSYNYSKDSIEYYTLNTYGLLKALNGLKYICRYCYLDFEYFNEFSFENIIKIFRIILDITTPTSNHVKSKDIEMYVDMKDRINAAKQWFNSIGVNIDKINIK